MKILTFNTQLSKVSYIWLAIVIALVLLLRYEKLSNGHFISTLVVFVILAIVWYFVFYYSKYILKNDQLYIKTIYGEQIVNIKEIIKVEKGNSISKSGWLYFWYPYQKGLNIHYNKYNEVFVNPVQQDNFIAHLLVVNPSIEII